MLSLLRAARAKLSSALAPAALAPAQNVVRVDVKPDATSEGTP